MCFVMLLCDCDICMVLFVLQMSVSATPTSSSCAGDLASSGDTYTFSTSKQLYEDIAVAEALLACRRDTRDTLRLHYPSRHQVEAGRLGKEVRQAEL